MRGEDVAMRDFDNWKLTKHARNWLSHHKATELGRRYGFIFFVHPIYGEAAPILAVKNGSGPASRVWNTHNFDLPFSDPMQGW